MDQRKMQQPPYIGSKISLISKLDIRYQGILYTVDPIDSTITLAKVQSYGTEDRRTAIFVQPKNDVYDFIIFKASDIKDLIVCEQPKANSPENIVGANLPYDPAIVSISKNPPPEPKLPPKQLLGGRLPNFPSQQHYNFSSQQQHHRTKHLSMSYIYDGPQVPMDKDYDFEKANEQFHEKIVRDNMKGKENLDQNQQGETKEEEMKEQTDPVEVSVQRNSSVFEEFYNKNNSFFDNISCDALEKQSGNNVRPDWKRERQTNQETFGHSAVRSLFYQQRRSGIIRGFTHGGSGVAVGKMMIQMPLRYGNGTNYNNRFPTNYHMKYQ